MNKINKGLRTVSLKGLLFVVLSFEFFGCSTTKINPDAFGSSKTYALVSVIYNPDINYFGGGKGFTMGGGTTASGLIKAAGKNNGYSRDAQEIFKTTFPKVLKAFQSTKSFKLLPERTVLKSEAYKRAVGSKPKILWSSFNLPPGYKYFDGENTITKLARDLHVDGVIIMHIAYGYTFKGVGFFGLVSAGTERGAVRINLFAINREGKTVWQDFYIEESTESIGAVGESADFEKIHPLIIDAAIKSATGILDNLEKNL
jgi:hypothetical protein